MSEVDLGLRIFLDDMLSQGIRGIVSSISMFSNQIQQLESIQGQLGASIDSLVVKMLAAETGLRADSEASALLTPAYQDLQTVQSDLIDQMALLDAQYDAGAMHQLDYIIESTALQDELAVSQGFVDKMDQSMADLSTQMGVGQAAMDSLGARGDVLDEKLSATIDSTNALKVGLAGLGVAAGGAVDLLLFAGGLIDATKAAADLQDSLINVQIALQATDQQMVVVGQTITSVADSSIFSTTQVADGFRMLAQRGWSATDIVQHLGQASVDLATAMGSETSPAADLLARTVKVFGANAGEATYYASALTFAFEHGIPSVTDLSTSLDQTAEVAKQTNTPINELVATLDFLNQNGLKAGDAATSLRYMMQALIAPIPKAVKALSDLGIITIGQVTPAFKAFENQLDATGKKAHSTITPFTGTVDSLQKMFTEAQKLGVIKLDEDFSTWAGGLGILKDKLYDSNGKLNDWFTNLQLIGDKLKGKTQKDFNDALSNLFSVRSGKGGGLLLQDIGTTMAQLDKLSGGLLTFSSSGGVVKQAALKADDLNGATKRLGTTFQSTMAQIGGAFVGPLTSLYGWLNNVMSSVASTGTTLTTSGSVFLVTGTVLSGLALIAGIAASAFMLIPVALLPVIGIAAGVAAGIMVLALVGGLIAANWKPIAAFFSPLAPLFANIGGVLSSSFAPALSQMRDGWNEIMTAIKPFIAQIQPFIPLLKVLAGVILLVVVGALSGLIAMLGAIIHMIAGIMAGLINIITGAIQIFKGAIQVIAGIVMMIIGIFQFLFTGKSDILTAGRAAFIKGLGNMLGGIIHIIQGIFQVVGSIIVGFINGVLSFFGHMVSGIIGLVGGPKIAASFNSVLDGLIKTISAFPGKAMIFIENLVKGIIGWFQHMADQLYVHSIVPDTINAIIGWIAKLPGAALSMIQNFVSNIINGAKGLANSFHDTVIKPILDKVNDFIKTAETLGGNIISNLASGIVNGIAGALGNAMNAVGNFIHDHLPHSPAKRGPLMHLAEQGAEIPNQIALGIHKNVGVLGAAAVRMGNVLTPQHFTNAAFSSIGGSGAGGVGSSNNPITTVNFVMDGKVVSQAVMDRFTGQLKMNGSGRSFK